MLSCVIVHYDMHGDMVLTLSFWKKSLHVSKHLNVCCTRYSRLLSQWMKSLSVINLENESYRAVLSSSAVYYAVQGDSNF